MAYQDVNIYKKKKNYSNKKNAKKILITCNCHNMANDAKSNFVLGKKQNAKSLKIKFQQRRVKPKY